MFDLFLGVALAVVTLMLVYDCWARRDFPQKVDRACWTLLIVLVPLIGPMIYFFAVPANDRHARGERNLR